jgi:GNAT superfamily N-acetyltransferase
MRLTELLVAAEHNIVIVPPSRLSSSDKQQIADLINAGGEVRPEGVLAGINRALLLGLGIVDNVVVAVSAIKQPLSEYKAKVFASAGVPEQAGTYTAELGFTYTKPEYRSSGVTVPLHTQLLRQCTSKLFTTVRSDNRIALLLVKRIGFKELGTPYMGRTNTYTVTLLVK